MLSLQDCQMPVMDGFQATIELRLKSSTTCQCRRPSAGEEALSDAAEGSQGEDLGGTQGEILPLGSGCFGSMSSGGGVFWGRCRCCPAIIAVTASAVRGAEYRCREVGMNGFVAKPIQLKDVALMLLRCLGQPGL